VLSDVAQGARLKQTVFVY